MNLMRIVGIVLILAGIVALVARGIAYTTKDTVIDAGPVEVTKEDREYIPLPPVLGGVAVLLGAVILFGASKRR